ncbi:hypothetical protein N7540_008473 [Penicillium herquei]|nr:hypothetical protein N7540_008473 [Penicillium herquei]
MTDDTIAFAENMFAWHALIRYMHSGGTVILTGRFGECADRGAATNMFRDVQKQWVLGQKQSDQIFINKDSLSQPIQAILAPSSFTEGCFVFGASQDDAWYRAFKDNPTGDDRPRLPPSNRYLDSMNFNVSLGDDQVVVVERSHTYVNWRVQPQLIDPMVGQE